MLILKVVALVIATYALISLLVWKFQTRLIFMPTRRIRHTPASLGVPGEEVQIPFQSRDGKQEILHGFWLPADGPKVILYFHGNGDNIGVNLPHAVLLRSLGISVLLFDYRGYGRSTGSFPSEARVCEDAEAAWRYLVNERHYSPRQIVIYGHSLGGAIAIEIANRHPEASALIVESSFTSVVDMARHTGIVALFPLRLLLENRFDSIAKISALRMPILLMHGTRDWTVPSRMTHELFAAASEPKTLVIIQGGSHLDNSTIGGQLYLDAVREFIR
jgi:pimeloyl-ACP methyl ester carboxylesterase